MYEIAWNNKKINVASNINLFIAYHMYTFNLDINNIKNGDMHKQNTTNKDFQLLRVKCKHDKVLYTHSSNTYMEK